MSNLKSKALKSVGWLSALRFISQIIVIVKFGILARLLTPSDFGIFALVAATLTTIDVLSDMGFNSAAIYLNYKIEKLAKSLLIVNIGRGILLSIIILILIPILVFVFGPKLMSYLVMASIIPLIKSFTNPNIITFQKELNFKKVFILQIIPLFVNVFVSIIFAFIFRDAKALVLGLIISSFIEVAVSYTIAKFYIKYPIKKTYIKRLFSYGKWITAGGIAFYLSTQIDNFIVGKVLGTQTLGLYDLSYKTANIVSTQFTDIVSQVAFPLYSKRKNNKQHLRLLFKKNMVVTSIVAFIVIIPLILFPVQILTNVFGEKWKDAGTILQILSVSGFLRATIGPVGPLLLALGKPNTLAKINIVNVITIIILIYPLTINFGVTGTALTILISNLLVFIIYLVATRIALRNG